MSRSAAIRFAFVFAVIALSSLEAQSTRSIYVGGGLGHSMRGITNPPLRLTDDVLAVVSDGGSSGPTIPDDQIVIVSGFRTGQLVTANVGFYTALGITGDSSSTLTRLSDTSLLYVDHGVLTGTPTLMIVSDIPATNTVTTFALDKVHALDPDQQTVAVLDADTIAWVAPGADGLSGTYDDLVVAVKGLAAGAITMQELAIGVPLAADTARAGDSLVAVRALGADQLPGSGDDSLYVCRVLTGSVTVHGSVDNISIGAFLSQRGPVTIADADPVLIFPSVARTNDVYEPLYVAFDHMEAGVQATVFGTQRELPLGWIMVPTPIDIGGRAFAYISSGSNRQFHDSDDEVKVHFLAPGANPASAQWRPGVGLGMSDTSVPPVSLATDRLVFPSSGHDRTVGNYDDGFLVVENLHAIFPTYLEVVTGSDHVALAKLNPSAISALDSSGLMSYVLDIGTPSPQLRQWTTPLTDCGFPVRINDWTLMGGTNLSDAATDLRDDLLAIHFPWIELFGDASACGSGSHPAISQVTPYLGSTYFATVSNVPPGAAMALVLAWYGGEAAINHQAKLWLDSANIFEDHVTFADGFGSGFVPLYLRPLPWLTGLSFAGQWGVFDPTSVGSFCVSSGFRLHLE